MRKSLERRLQTLRWGFRSDQAGKIPPPPSVEAAAKYLNLDLRDPGQRDLLLFVLAEAIFGKGSAGRPKGRSGLSGGWNMTKLDHLALLHGKYRRDGFRGDKKIAEQIHANHNGQFGSTAEAIRRWLPYARWVHEERLEKHRDYGPPEGWEPPEPDYDPCDE